MKIETRGLNDLETYVLCPHSRVILITKGIENIDCDHSTIDIDLPSAIKASKNNGEYKRQRIGSEIYFGAACL
jgi:hypothetical protein